MGRPVYSSLLYSAAGFTGPTNVSTPAGYTMVVRDIDVYWVLGLTSASFDALTPVGATFAHMAWDPVTDGSSVKSWRGRQVFPAGAYFTLRADSAIDVTVSGYLLSDL